MNKDCQFVVAGSLAFILVAGCSSSSLPSDPVSDYKQFLHHQFEEYAEKLPRSSFASEYGIDVRKTDSLVSPFVGTCTVDVLYHKPPAKNASGSLKYMLTIEMTHAFQDGRWVLTSGNADLKGAKATDFRTKKTDLISYLALRYDYETHYSFESVDDFVEKTISNFSEMKGLRRGSLKTP